MILTGYLLSSLIAVGIVFIGCAFVGPCRRITCLRYPQFSIAVDRLYRMAGCEGRARHRVRPFYLPADGDGSPRLLGEFLLVASLIALGDAAIVLRSGGSRTAAFGIHGLTALVIIAAGASLIGAAN